MIDQYTAKYGTRLYGLCLHLCTNSMEADDLYQDTWLKVLKKIDQYDRDREFEPWLTTICVNTYRNALRKLSRSPLLNFSTSAEKDTYLHSIPAPEKDEYLDVHVAVDALPEKLRIAVVLFYFEDMDIASTAQILGIPEGTVKSRLSKARKRLKEVLGHGTDI